MFELPGKLILAVILSNVALIWLVSRPFRFNLKIVHPLYFSRQEPAEIREAVEIA